MRDPSDGRQFWERFGPVRRLAAAPGGNEDRKKGIGQDARQVLPDRLHLLTTRRAEAISEAKAKVEAEGKTQIPISKPRPTPKQSKVKLQVQDLGVGSWNSLSRVDMPYP
jgi:hypothetical protein